MKFIPEICARMEIVRDWEIVDQIGEGGYGVVYRIRKKDSGEEAALKWIHIERESTSGFDATAFLDAQTNLLNEISVMRKLSDTPEIVSIYDAACQIAPDGNAMDVLIRMELLTPLTDMLKNGEITVLQVKEIADHVGRALSVCHERGIIHGDVKPENILHGKNGFKLSDFGVSLSRLLSGNTAARGTQYFRPPEYDLGESVSKQGDIYSLGMMLYVLFNNGRLPFQKGFSAEDEYSAWQECRNLVHLPDCEVPPPQFAAPGVAEVICRAISPKKDSRYVTAQEFLSAFDMAFKALSVAEAALHLPYCKSDEYLSQEVKMYLSTGRKTPRFDLSFEPPKESKPDPQPVKTAPASDFVIPPSDFKKEKEKEKDEEKEPAKKKKKRSKALVFLIFALFLLAAGAVFAYFYFVPSSFEFEKEIHETGAVFRLLNTSSKTFEVTLVPDGAPDKSITAKGENGTVAVSGLVPGTKYSVVLTADKRNVETEITTLPDRYENSIHETSASFTLVNTKAESLEAALLPKGASHGKITAKGENGTVTVSGLVPGTKYSVVLTADKRNVETEITTLSEKDGNFTPYDQKVYTVDAHVAGGNSFAQLEKNGSLTEVTDGELHLRNVSLSEQGKMIYVEFRCVSSIASIDSESEMLVTVIDEQGNIYTASLKNPPMLIPMEKVRLHYNLTGIFERMFAENGKQVSGKVTVRMYWLNETVGSVELDVRSEG